TVPVFIGVLGCGLAQNRACIVHQNIYDRNVAFDLLDETVESLAIAEVAGITSKAAAARDHLALERTARDFERSAHADDVGSCLGQRHCHRLADAAAGS